MPPRVAKKLQDLPLPAGGYVLEEQVGFCLRLAMQRHTSIFMARMVEELTQPQFAALAKLHAIGPCSQNHLGRLVALDAATTKGVVDRLEARGFVSSVNVAHDRRRRVIGLTDLGLDVIRRAEAVAAAITADTLAPLPAEERAELVRLLSKIS